MRQQFSNRGSASDLAAVQWVLLAACHLLALGGCRSGRDGQQSKTQTDGKQPHGRPPVTLPARAEPPAPKPTGPLPAGATCVTSRCHASYATARYVHAPLSPEGCRACHLPDAGAHRYPLARGPSETCTYCHAVSGGAAAYQHKALAQGCAACHKPHVAETKFLLKADTIPKLCATCHVAPARQYAHWPFAKGDCSVCHEPHQAAGRALLRGEQGVAHCTGCHENFVQLIATAPVVHEPVRKQCVACHNAHASDYPRQLNAPAGQSCLGCHDRLAKRLAEASTQHGALQTDGRCANCHDPHAAAQPKLLHQRADRLCLQCHDRAIRSPAGRLIANIKPVLTESRYLHGPVRAGNCVACHDSHGSSHVALLRVSFPRTFYAPFDASDYALCFSCHQREMVLAARTDSLTAFRNGSTNLHYLHVNREQKGRTCKACHSVHASNLPKHLAETVAFEGSTWKMPLSYRQTPDGGKCASGCHVPRAYSRALSTSNPDDGGPR